MRRALALTARWMTVLLATVCSAQAQDGATVTGQVVDGISGLELSDVRVQIQGQPGSVLTDARGQFTLRGVPPGTHVLTVSVVGFVMVRRELAVGDGGSIYLVIPLTEGTGTYTERVEVTGDLFRQGEAAVPAQQVLGSAELQNLRGLVLDDPVRAMHILPGVAATDDLYSEFSVRGSDFGRIGLAVDGVPSRFLSHSVQGVEDGGSIGMINSDVLESVSLQNGSYPQRFGNRTGAQIEMTLREGSRDRDAGARRAQRIERVGGWRGANRTRPQGLVAAVGAQELPRSAHQADRRQRDVCVWLQRRGRQGGRRRQRAPSGAGERAGRPRRARRGSARHRAKRPAGRDQSRMAGRARVALHSGAAAHLDAARGRHRR